LILASAVSCRGAGRPPVGGRGPEFITTSGKRAPPRPEKNPDIFWEGTALTDLYTIGLEIHALA